MATPYPGTEIWFTESRRLTWRDYHLFDVSHALLPTRKRIDKFYGELVKSQEIPNRKHLGWGAIPKYGSPAVRALMRGQTNYIKMLWNFTRVVNENRQYKDHQRPVTYEMKPSKPVVAKPDPAGSDGIPYCVIVRTPTHHSETVRSALTPYLVAQTSAAMTRGSLQRAFRIARSSTAS